MWQSKSFRFDKPARYNATESFMLLALGRRDPSFRRLEERGWQTLRWINGELCRITLGCGESVVGVRVDGPEQALAAIDESHAHALLGLHDEPPWQVHLRDPLHPYALAKPGLRLVRAFWIYEGALNVIICQRVSWAEAALNWQRLCLKFGEERDGLFSAPSPRRLLSLSYPELASCGIETKRATPLKEVALRLQSVPSASMEPDMLEGKLLGCRGVGPWTRTLLRAQFWGDPDAVPLGDYGMPGLVCGVLAGERPGTDERMLELLEPYRGHRFRVIRLLWVQGSVAARRGPRLPMGQALGW